MMRLMTTCTAIIDCSAALHQNIILRPSFRFAMAVALVC